MQYQCCNCRTLFDGRRAIDGYGSGYREGFLCPNCNANIKSDRFKKPHVIGRKHLTLAIFLTVFGGMLWGREFTELVGVPWQLAGGLLMVLAALRIYLANRKNPEAFAIPTQLVNRSRSPEYKA